MDHSNLSPTSREAELHIWTCPVQGSEDLWLSSAYFFCHIGLAMHLSHTCSLLWDLKLKGPVMWPVCHRGRGTSSPVLSMCRAQVKTGAESQGLEPRGGSEGSEGWSHPATGGPTVAPNPDTGLALARWA